MENEPELVREHIPFLLWDGARSYWGPLVHLFIPLYPGPGQGADGVSDTLH